MNVNNLVLPMRSKELPRLNIIFQKMSWERSCSIYPSPKLFYLFYQARDFCTPDQKIKLYFLPVNSAIHIHDKAFRTTASQASQNMKYPNHFNAFFLLAPSNIHPIKPHHLRKNLGQIIFFYYL